MKPRPFNAGDDILLPVTVTGEEGKPVDLSEGSFSVAVFERDRKLFDAAFIEENPLPGPDQNHGFVHITDQQTRQIGRNKFTYVKGTFVRRPTARLPERTVSTEPIYLERKL